MKVEANEMRPLGAQSAVHLLEDALPFQAYNTMLGKGVNTPVPVLYSDDGTSEGQGISHYEQMFAMK